MVSWQTDTPPPLRSRFSRPPTRCGDQPSPSRPAARRPPLRPPRDPLRRPAVPEPPDHVLPQGLVGGQLAATPPASARRVPGVQGEVAAEPAVAVAEAVAAQLPMDGGRVPAEPRG